MDEQVFISHSSKDGNIAQSLCEYLECRQVKCFIAPRDIRPGFEYADEIVTGTTYSYRIRKKHF